MFINKEQMIKLDTDLGDVKAAILKGEPVLFRDSEGWTKTEQIILTVPRVDYHIGEVGPALAPDNSRIV